MGIAPVKHGQDREKVGKVQMQARAPFRRWLAEYARFRHVSVADTLTQAVVDQAKRDGFDPVAPER